MITQKDVENAVINVTHARVFSDERITTPEQETLLAERMSKELCVDAIDVVLEAAKEQHGLVARWGCGATSAPTENVHRHSGRIEAKKMHCTEDQGHDGDHKDGNCCWSPHTFTEAQVVEYRPIDRRQCKCGRTWRGSPLSEHVTDKGCAVGAAIEQYDLARSRA